MNEDLERQLHALYRQAPSARVGAIRIKRSSPWVTYVGRGLTTAVVVVVAVILGAALAADRSGNHAATQPSTAATAQADRIGLPRSTRVCAFAANRDLLVTALEAQDRSVCDPFVSTDGGASWRSLPLSSQPSVTPQQPRESVSAVAIGPNGSLILLGTTNGRILRADGPTAALVDAYEAPAGTFQPAVERFVFEGGRVYAALRGLLESDDLGRNWRDISARLGGLGADITQRPRFGVGGPVVLQNEIVVGIGGNTPGVTGLWSTADDGATWRRFDGSELTGGGPATGEQGMAAGNFGLAIAAPGPGRTTLTGTPLPLVSLTMDHGRSWIAADSGLPGSVDSLAVVSGQLVAETASGPFVFGPDRKWHAQSGRLPDYRLLGISGGTIWGESGGALIRIEHRP